MKRFFALLLVLGSVVFWGAGCPSISLPAFSNAEGSDIPSSTLRANAEAIRFTAGDTFDLQQTFLGFGAPTQNQQGVRHITIAQLEPSVGLNWEMMVERETDASKTAREKYDADLRAHPRAIGEQDPILPAITFERATLKGTLENINLASSNALRLPSYWKEGTDDAAGSSAIWFSKQAFQTLLSTRQTSVALGLTESPFTAMMRAVDAWNAFQQALKSSTSTQKEKADPNSITADGQFIPWKLHVNGKDEFVSAVRAHSKYGDLVILNNPENPLVLKFTMNPFSSEAIFGDRGGFVQNFLGFEVKNVRLAR
ncbi:MAG: hypothetical protein Q7R83_03745 [bacterium]|nr:hypothetical protein [bacterium]